MRVRVHRGTREIGGTCIELAAAGKRILLDLGLPLDGDPADPALHPKIEGLGGGGDLLALVLSHGHLDHRGLAHLAGPDLPVALGAATLRILRAASPFVPDPWVPLRPVEMVSGAPLRFGPFTVTPHLVDHSAYDAYALEVEAGGVRLFYSGDLRGHGRKATLFERMVARPPKAIDVMLMEGSSLGRIGPGRRFPTEREIEERLVGIFRGTPGMPLVAASAQNIDRMVTLFRACRRTGRRLILDLYAAEILRATGNPNIPQTDWPDVALFTPHRQRVHVKRNGLFDTLSRHDRNRVWPEDLRHLAPRSALLFRQPMLPDLVRAGCLGGAICVWSQWSGYLGKALAADLASQGVQIEHAHTSGHASIDDLQRLARAVAPKALVPVHAFEPHRFADFFDNVTVRGDGEWWEAGP